MPDKLPLRPGQACLECRRRKMKCDGQRPTCARCEKLHKTCVFQPLERKTAFTQILQEKILALENNLEELSGPRSRLVSHPLFLLDPHASESSRSTPQPIVPVRRLIPQYKYDPGVPIEHYPPGRVSRTCTAEGYGAVVPCSVIEDKLRYWDPQTEIDPQTLNYLYGCGNLSRFEPIFLARTRQYMDQALAYADRLLHFTWASVILSTYYGRAGRVLECHNTVSTAVRFALGFRLNSRVGSPTPDNLTTQEAIDLMEEKSLWYALYLLDTNVASRFDLPGAMPEECVTELNAIFVYLQSQDDGSCDPVLHWSMRAIGIVGCVHALKLKMKEQENAGWQENTRRAFRAIRTHQLDLATSVLREVIPPLDDPIGLLPGETMGPLNFLLVRPHILLYSASIHLYNISAHEDPKAYHRALRAAVDMGTLMRRMRASAPLSALQIPAIHIADIYTACEVLIRDLHQPSRTPGSPPFLAAEQALEPLFDGLLDLIHLYPTWAPPMSKLRNLLEGTQAYDII
ncbi:hypothetical protein BS47DRAFT_1398967 [Hydnum rufescens UP504]|uniref:Zn(2)-C6 fungal-type domain-containing protein n=1 Tax=Hydnum rufescens UP504 TaxID=1448309 RepID=A0A9P6DLL3_9AGAM|nr:hypothetical protein BS47DRAFT_1398967 [Hydnum rufescens UP504]